jgi:hypothetical protein
MKNLSFTDFKGNYKQLLDIKHFVLNSSDLEIMLIIGDHSTGKSFLGEIISKIDTIETIILNDTNCSDELLNNFIHSKTIISMFSKKSKFIFIDDVNTIIGNDKNFTSYFTKYVNKCKFILTVRSGEEKKLSSIKKYFSHKIYLKKLDFKECFQHMLSIVPNISEIDTDKLLELVKNLNCNIPKILQLIESTYIDHNIDVIQNQEDVFTDNIYTVIKSIYNSHLNSKQIYDITLKDSQLLSLLMHENLINLNYKHCDIDTLISIYSVLTNCDILDKHIYINCNWGINFIMINYYRFSSINTLLKSKYTNDINIVFTKQFTQLSSQTSVKKKIVSYCTAFLQNCIIDFLLYTYSNKLSNNKFTKDFVNKFCKDFKIKSL